MLLRSRIGHSASVVRRCFSCSRSVLEDTPKSSDLADKLRATAQQKPANPESTAEGTAAAPIDAIDTSLLFGDLMGSSRRVKSASGPIMPTSKIFKQDASAPADAQKYYLHCLTSHSNTLLTLTNYKHEPILWTSGGLCGFKKAARGGYEAGFRSTITMLEKMQRKEAEDRALLLKERTEPSRVQKTAAKKRKAPFKPREIELVIKEFGLGREAVMKALAGQEGDYYRGLITKVIDATPLKFGGVRARAVRRL
ncbi:hypothetical protein BCR37DRAFT_387755 [Protomyces lactucae-debilis]|uniref:Uncharacterized protein n=1 Tax=Protomyces lactucae-debilis TaxID=2754530 RepID=A0A1Y2FC48_PROLT|nr:uncharacterized protein BCR37DRAFT_387755 [Protomyces lactucae-debilis]ORY81498.1 hypothetical protein BCR37DRAFT_387755 [Protomyces lactucae-debilis]